MYARLSDLRTNAADKTEPLLKRLHQLSEERDMVYRFPVWPFDTSSLRKFFGLAFTPLVPILTSLLCSRPTRGWISIPTNTQWRGFKF